MSSSKMSRQFSHASSSNSTSSPKPRFRLFLKKEKDRNHSTSTGRSSDIGSPDLQGNDIEFEPDHSAGMIPTSPSPTLPDLNFTSTRSNGFPSPDMSLAAAHDSEYKRLKANIRRIGKAPAGPDPKKVDQAWEIYKNLREDSLQICQSLLCKSQSTGRNFSMDTNFGPLDTRSSLSSSSLTETTLPFHVNDQWLSAIHEYKAAQEQILENITNSLLATFRFYVPDQSERQVQAFLADEKHRRRMMAGWRDTSVHAMRSHPLLFWEQYKIRSRNLDTIRLDLQSIEKLFEVAETGDSDNMTIREYEIAKNGDAILEFPNKVSEIHPVLRFRVSSQFLAANSPLFSYMLLPQQPGENPPLDMMKDLPPPPLKHVCKDGMEVKVYRMPQIELNKHDALTILLHAAHMNNEKVPREIEFPVFVSIAEVCLRYRCTSPLEEKVECRWLPQWMHRVVDANPDGLLLITYAFGIRRIFTRLSKTAILNSSSDSDIQSKDIWPQAVRDKIKAIRSAKLAQIHDCCTSAISEYFRPPGENVDRKAGDGTLAMTTVPRCPKRSHQCDATNLGWLMLVFNELRELPSIMNKVGFHNLPPSPSRSLKELVDCLRMMPSAPQVHSGVCDYAPSFRSAIDDIHNSISGLTLRDVSGRDGWALSKDAGPNEDCYDDDYQGVPELEASSLSRKAHRSGSKLNENISLRILSYIDDVDDLNAAALVDKTFYSAYKRNEGSLLRNVMKAERRRTLSQVGALEAFRSSPGHSRSDRNHLTVSTNTGNEVSKYLASDIPRRPLAQPIATNSNEDLYDVSPRHTHREELPMSDEEAERILWPSNSSVHNAAVRNAPSPGLGNEKFIPGDNPHADENSNGLARGPSRLYDKARIVGNGDGKHLREEKDKILGLGASHRSLSVEEQGRARRSSRPDPDNSLYGS